MSEVVGGEVVPAGLIRLCATATVAADYASIPFLAGSWRRQMKTDSGKKSNECEVVPAGG